MKAVSISHLADYPEFIDRLAEWHHDQWGSMIPGATLENRVEKLRAEMNRKELPMALVAHRDSTVLGSASLRAHDMHGRSDLGPWLGGVYVGAAHRRQGIGARLVRAVEDKARDLGIELLYLFTPDKEGYYQGLGWETTERTAYRDFHHVVIMRRSL